MKKIEMFLSTHFANDFTISYKLNKCDNFWCPTGMVPVFYDFSDQEQNKIKRS